MILSFAYCKQTVGLYTCFAVYVFNDATEPYFALALLCVSYSLSHGDNGWHMLNISLCFPPPAQAPTDKYRMVLGQCLKRSLPVLKPELGAITPINLQPLGYSAYANMSGWVVYH